jgi:hypothetical protein
MSGMMLRVLGVLAAALLLAGCASRPINARLDRAVTRSGYRFETRPIAASDSDTIIVLAFSGGGTRAAAFSHGVLEETIRRLRQAGAFANAGNVDLARAVDIPDTELYSIDVSFTALDDSTERDYLNGLPTSFVLTDEQVDRLRAAAALILRASPEYQRMLRELSGIKAAPTSTAAQ